MIDQLSAERRKKADALREGGSNPFPARVGRTTSIASFTTAPLRTLRVMKKTLVGRVVQLRNQGKLAFIIIADESGRVQVVLRPNTFAGFHDLMGNLDLGDFLEVRGRGGKTRNGTFSMFATEARIVSKALRPIPSDYYGISDKETLLRQRYLELLGNPDLRAMFQAKSRFWGSMRKTLEQEGFIAVETPILETTPGGAEAEPFKSKHNAFDMEVYLRIAPELWLKRLMVAGFEKVYEIGRVFRNEGSSPEHLQDFTNLEFYWAYQDYNGLMTFVENMVKEAIYAAMGTLVTKKGDVAIDWGQPWPRLEYYDLFKKENGLDLKTATKEQLYARAQELGIDQASMSLGRGRLIDLVYKKSVRPKLIQPCYLINPPVDIEPLAKRHPEDEHRVERFQLLAAGTELAKGFSELNDADDQRGRFESQAQLREEGDPEAMRLDEDYLEAMEYGMPPTAGLGLGDRLFATIVDKPIRETVLFPLVRPK